MLAKAVKEHKPAASSAPLAQQLFPSSSSTPSREADLPWAKASKPNALMPASSSVINSSLPALDKKHTNPLKRTISEMSLSSNGSIAHGGGRSAQSSATLMNGGIVNKLHDEVWFDENDFADDNDLDLDFSKTTSKSYQTPLLRPYGNDPKHTPSSEKNQPSSIPIPWSLSPSDNKTGTVNYPALPKLSDDRSSDVAKNEIETEKPRIPKRRTVPWLAKAEETAEPERDGMPKFVQDIIDRQKKQRRTVTNVEEAVTPLPKNKTKSPHPWNKTASAIKEEQKKHRQQGKKIVKDVQREGSEDNTGKKKVKSSKKTVRAVFLSDEQKKVLDLVVNAKKSVFFTGSAGTGKSVLMREIIEVFRRSYLKEPDRVAVTASTGLAACNVGGVTLHSFSGIGLGKEAAEELVKKIRKNAKAKNRWMRTKVLIIDEISMVDGELFDKLERIARMIRGNGRPFGGIQLVVTGDFFQLPPVPDYGKVAKFAFEAGTWGTSIEHTIGLTQVFRQKDPSE